MLSVSAREQTTGVQAQIEVKPSYGLDDETITQMLRDSMNNAKDDAAARARAEAKVEAESLIGAIQAALDLDADLLSEEELNKINQLMTKPKVRKIFAQPYTNCPTKPMISPRVAWTEISNAYWVA